MLQETLAQFGEIDVEHHDYEQKQHRHCTDIDDHQRHGDIVRAQKHEQRRGIKEGEDEEEHRMHRIARRNHHRRRKDHHGGK